MTPGLAPSQSSPARPPFPAPPPRAGSLMADTQDTVPTGQPVPRPQRKPFTTAGVWRVRLLSLAAGVPWAAQTVRALYPQQ